jgi:opacity protein-like surface antigen
MKKIMLYAAAVLLLGFVVTPQRASAQKYQGQVVVGANGAFSLVGLVMTTTFNSLGYVQGLTTSTTPGLSGTVDFGVTDRFSIGIAHFYQSANAKWNTYQDTNGVIQAGDFHYRVTRQNTAIRALFHFGDNDDVDPYFGVRLGYSYWKGTSNVADIDQLLDFGRFGSHFWPQAIFGIRYFFIPNFGVNTEVALGFPYYLSVGLNARFGGGN